MVDVVPARAPGETAEEALNVMVQADQCLAIQRSAGALVLSSLVIGGATTAVALHSAAEWIWPLAWFALIVASNACRIYVCGFEACLPNPPEKQDCAVVERQLRRITVSSFCSGSVWALVPLLCGNQPSSNDTIFFMTVVCGVCAGSVIYSAAYAAVPVAFVTPALAAVAAWLLASGGFNYVALAAMVFVYLVALVHASLKGDRTFQANSRIKNEALFMAAELRQAHAESMRSALELEFRATHDPLTGLLNRSGFLHEASHIEVGPAARRANVAMMLDLDGFKAVNDAFGHATGDRLLQDVGRWLQNRLARHHAVVGRWGGDEFSVFFRAQGFGDAPETIARDLIETITLATSHSGGPLGLSIGLCTGMDCPVADLLVFADEALYEAKRQGRNRSCAFDDTLHARLRRRRDIERDLGDAMSSDAILAWYQPILGDAGRRLHSLEALLRWQHPVHGWVSPPDVICAAAAVGLAERLLRHMLTQVLCGIAQRAAAGLGCDDVPVAMNISPREMSQLPVDEIVLGLLKEHRVSPRLLHIEVTEEIALDTKAAMTRLQALSQAGVAIVVDDFGVGYSSLDSLRGEHVRQVKIDRSFVQGLMSSPRSRLMVESMIGLGRSLNIDVVAEGVENRQELETLTAMGCPLMQGFYFARPADLTRTLEWAANADLN